MKMNAINIVVCIADKCSEVAGLARCVCPLDSKFETQEREKQRQGYKKSRRVEALLCLSSIDPLLCIHTEALKRGDDWSEEKTMAPTVGSSK